MSEKKEAIERLWAVSELEQRVAIKPDATAMRTLADHYDDLGWADEARRLRENAADLPDEFETAKADEPASKPAVAVAEVDTRLKGRFTPRSLVEIIQVLHLTGKSGTLVAEAVGGLAATVNFAEGSLVEAHATGGEEGEAALHLAVRIKGGCYHFKSGTATTEKRNLPEDSAALVAAFAAEVAEK
jgi:hypothetical protein